MNRRQFTKLLAGAGLLLAGCRAGAAPSSSTPERKDSMQTTTQTYTRTTPIETVRNDPVFGDYGRLIFPVERSYYSGDTLEQLHLTYYNNIDPDETVDICNTLRQRAADGQTIFYDIYTEDEKAADPDKADTGLFYFKGNPGAKFSICNAGGAFAYVGAMQDSFPHALELSRKEYNAFALIYRPGAQTACEDLARAIAFVFTHAEELEVDTSGYSLWGGSAGARMAAWLGSYGTASFGEQAYPQPGAVIMQYTGLGEVYGNEPPTYACVGDRDSIADERVMRWRIANGNADPAAFMQGIEAMAQELVKTYASVLGEKQELFKTEKTEIGKCPRCKSPVYEGKKNYYCSNKECGFTMWKNDRFFEERKTVFTRSIAAALLKSGKVKVKKLYSPKTGKTYDGTVLLADTGGKYVNYKVTISKDKELE